MSGENLNLSSARLDIWASYDSWNLFLRLYWPSESAIRGKNFKYTGCIKLFNGHHHWRGTKQKRNVRGRAFKNPTKPEGWSCSEQKDCVCSAVSSHQTAALSPVPYSWQFGFSFSAYTCTQNIWMHICLQHRQPSSWTNVERQAQLWRAMETAG